MTKPPDNGFFLFCFFLHEILNISFFFLIQKDMGTLSYLIKIIPKRQLTMSSGLRLSSLQTNTDTFANSADPDETAHNETSHQDLYCLPFCY